MMQRNGVRDIFQELNRYLSIPQQCAQCSKKLKKFNLGNYLIWLYTSIKIYF